MLIDAEALRSELPDVVVLDVRWRLGGPPARADYQAGHIPGAAFVDLDADLAGTPGVGGRHPLPDRMRLQESLRSWGISADSAVVVYDDRDATAAARAWWVLRWAGHCDVRVLDGGWAGWLDRGFEVSVEEPSPARGDVTVRAGSMPVLDAAGAARLARAGVLLDARAAPRYRGETEPVDPVAGHIPGALSAPTADNVDADGRFRPAAALRERFGELGVGAGTPVGVYCGSGVTAAHELLAMSLAGLDGALYAGSWSEWITDPDRPIALGAVPG